VSALTQAIPPPSQTSSLSAPLSPDGEDAELPAGALLVEPEEVTNACNLICVLGIQASMHVSMDLYRIMPY
jgi:hypothetical protein